MRSRPYLLFFIMALAAFAVAHYGFGTLAKLWVGDASFSEAVRTVFRIDEPIAAVGIVLLLIPFLVVALMAGSLARKRSLASAALLFAAGLLMLGYFYLDGHMGAERAMRERKWTAAGLAVGLLPFRCIPALAALLVARILIGHGAGSAPPPDHVVRSPE